MLKGFQTFSLNSNKEKYPSRTEWYSLVKNVGLPLAMITVSQKTNLSAPHAGKVQGVKDRLNLPLHMMHQVVRWAGNFCKIFNYSENQP